MAAVALLGLGEGDAAGGDAQRRGEHGAHVGGVELGVWGGIQWKKHLASVFTRAVKFSCMLWEIS